MAKRQKEWAKKERRKLVEALGGKCVRCGTRERLELDCIRPQGDKHHKVGSDSRIYFYRRQLQAGNLQVLCKTHNAEKSYTEDAGRQKEEAPF